MAENERNSKFCLIMCSVHDGRIDMVGSFDSFEKAMTALEKEVDETVHGWEGVPASEVDCVNFHDGTAKVQLGDESFLFAIHEVALEKDLGKSVAQAPVYDFDADFADVCAAVDAYLRAEDDGVTRKVNGHKPAYRVTMKLLEELCDRQFPELSETLFGGRDNDLVFYDFEFDGEDLFSVFYYNPDCNAGGQIVQCHFDREQAAKVVAGENWVDVVAENAQYLSDIETRSFFVTTLSLVEMKREGRFLGCGMEDVCREILEKKLAVVEDVLEEATETCGRQNFNSEELGDRSEELLSH